jgi:MFS family permease
LTVLFFSGIQKIVILTILFGNTLWNSLDIFIKQVSFEVFKIDHPEINYGYMIISAYVVLHLVAGLFIGIYAGRLPQKIDYYKGAIPTSISSINSEEIPRREKRKKRNWFLRPTGIFILVLSAGVIILSYLSTELEDNVAISVMIMILRSLAITFIWFVILAPIIKKYFQKFVAKRKSEYAKDLEVIISMFPKFKEIVNYCWKLSSDKKGYKRIRYFLSTSFYYLLLSK